MPSPLEKPNAESEPSSSTQTGTTRLSLLSRARASQPDAWCELVDLYGPLVAHWSRRSGLDSHATADVVQEVFAAVYQGLKRYQAQAKSGTFRAWLWTITANKLRDRHRKQRPHDLAHGGSSALLNLQSVADPLAASAEISDVEPTTQEQLQALMRRAMEQVKSEFEEKTWAIFIRSTIDLIDSQLVAEQFGVTAATVRKTRSRIMRRLRQQLGDMD